MGIFRQQIEVGAPDASRFEAVEAMVDTGASYSMLPRSLLAGLGIQPHQRRRFLLADSSVADMEVGRAWIRIDGRMEMSIVAFASDDAFPLLGAHALEGLGLAVDPVNKRLVEADAYLL